MKQGWTEVALGDVATVVSGATPKTSEPEFWGGEIPWVTPKDLSDLDGGKYLAGTPRTLTAEGLNSCAASMLPAGSVLLSSRAPIGLVAINQMPVATNQGLKSLVPRAMLDPSYLYWWLRTHRRTLESLGRGATFKEVSKAIVEGVEIPLPPLEEQKRIAAILDKADKLLAKRRAAIAHLDSLTQAIFLDMFGDVGGRTHDFPMLPLGTCCTIGGEYGAALSSVPDDADLPRYVRITDIMHNGELQVDSVSPAGPESGWQQFVLAPGDLLLARSGATVGKAFLFRGHKRPHVFAGYLVRFRPNHASVLPEFLFGVTRTPGYARWVTARQRTVAQPNISASQYANDLVIPLPPIELQSAYGRLMGALRREAECALSGLLQCQALIASLQARAFRGDL